MNYKVADIIVDIEFNYKYTIYVILLVTTT